MKLDEWLERYPSPPPIQKGGRVRITIAVSDDEYELLMKLVHQPETRAIYDGKVQNIFRHALHYYVWDMDALLEEGFKPIISQIRDVARSHSLGMTKTEIEEMLATRAQELNFLLDMLRVNEALDLYEDLLRTVAELPGTWASIVHELMYEPQTGIQRFRSRIRDMSDTVRYSLRQIEETYT